MRVDNLYYDNNEYCIEYKEIDEKNSWDLLICPNRRDLQLNLHFVREYFCKQR